MKLITTPTLTNSTESQVRNFPAICGSFRGWYKPGAVLLCLQTPLQLRVAKRSQFQSRESEQDAYIIHNLR